MVSREVVSQTPCQLVSGSSANGKRWQKPGGGEGEGPRQPSSLSASGGVCTSSSLSTEICAPMQLRPSHGHGSSRVETGVPFLFLPISGLPQCPLLAFSSGCNCGVRFKLSFTGETKHSDTQRAGRQNSVTEGSTVEKTSRLDHPGTG